MGIQANVRDSLVSAIVPALLTTWQGVAATKDGHTDLFGSEPAAKRSCGKQRSSDRDDQHKHGSRQTSSIPGADRSAEFRERSMDRSFGPGMS